MTPEQYFTLFMQPKPNRRSFPDQSQFDYDVDAFVREKRPGLFRRTVRYIAGLVK